MPEYLVGSLLCSINLLFIIVAVLLLSLQMSDIVAFLSVLGISIVGFVADGIAAAGHSQMVQSMVQQSAVTPQSEMTGWKIVYFLCLKLLGVQQIASALIEREAFRGLVSLYPLINIVLYCLILGGTDGNSCYLDWSKRSWLHQI